LVSNPPALPASVVPCPRLGGWQWVRAGSLLRFVGEPSTRSISHPPCMGRRWPSRPPVSPATSVGMHLCGACSSQFPSLAFKSRLSPSRPFFLSGVCVWAAVGRPGWGLVVCFFFGGCCRSFPPITEISYPVLDRVRGASRPLGLWGFGFFSPYAFGLLACAAGSSGAWMSVGLLDGAALFRCPITPLPFSLLWVDVERGGIGGVCFPLFSWGWIALAMRGLFPWSLARFLLSPGVFPHTVIKRLP
jgi:hypothetical protein